jgi:hypothetical protein
LLKKNQDGSFTIYIQSESPGPDKKPNCCRRPSGASSILFRAPTLRPENNERASNGLKDAKAERLLMKLEREKA